ncbi:type I restriction enzyme HsdR N-terminal domain-containing protein [Alloyangia pacifica]|uniref:type I restriction enzyme HsdR N-terminal domain-containing protein n=1 Tax=Alloyangia pacifica TaxID=311180 RepID=UPI0031DA319C
MPIIVPETLENLEAFNEAEVRAFIVDVILRKLGYWPSKDIYLKMEETLRYPYYYIGHKASKKDLPLGSADYRAGLKGRRGSFIVEAKAASIAISQADVEQAHSYASHAEVGANYFMLCNGKTLLLYETLSGPEHAALVELAIHELDERFHELENILSPQCLAKHCEKKYDTGLRLADGLSSVCEVRSGEYELKDWHIRLLMGGQDVTETMAQHGALASFENQLVLMRDSLPLKIADGIMRRDGNGRIEAKIGFQGATKNNLEGMKILGIELLEITTDDRFISSDPSEPSIFEASPSFSAKRGTLFPQLLQGTTQLETNIDGDMLVLARMYSNDQDILGDYKAIANYHLDAGPLGILKIEFEFMGSVNIRLMPS